MQRSALLVLSLVIALIISACSGGAADSDTGLIGENTPLTSTPAVQEPVDQELADDGSTGMEAGTAVDDGSDRDADQPGDSMEPAGGESATEDQGNDDGTMAENDAAADEAASELSPAYFSAELIDASTGETFTIDDFRGKVVLLETLAMWCSNCYRQQSEVKLLHEKLGPRTDFISLGLDIDPNENLADLKGYVEDNGFDWLYAVAPLDVARELGQLYSAQFLNPPSTPMLIIDRNGDVHTLPFGIKSADQLLEALGPFLDEG